MRIEIACHGGYRVDNFIDELDELYDRIEDTIEELKSIYKGLEHVNMGPTGNLSDACGNIQSRIHEEEEKQDSVLKIREKTQTFYETAVQIDKQVARQVDENSEKFFEKYAGLGTITGVEKSWWDEFVEGWKGFWGDVGDAIQSAWDGLCEFFTEYAVEMIVGAIGLVVGGAILVFGGIYSLATVTGMAVVAIGAVVLEASIAALIGYLQGGDFWEIFKEQFATGFMFAGIFFAVQAIFSAVMNFIKTKRAAKIIDTLDDVTDTVDDVADKADDTIKGGGEAKFDRTPELEEHIKNVDPSVPRKRGIGGAHNSKEFFKNDVKIESSTPSKIPGVRTVEYRMPRLNADGTPTGEYGAKIFKKTIYDPDIISDDEFIKRGLEAANDAMGKSENVTTLREWSEVDSQGIKWHGYIENGKITSFYPIE